MHPITQKVFDWIMTNRQGQVSEQNIKVAYEVITKDFPTRNDIMNIYEEIELHYPPRKSNPYSKTEIRTKPQFIWYRAYSKDAPSQTQLFFLKHSEAVEHLKLLKRHGYKNLMLQKVVEAYGEYAYDKPVEYGFAGLPNPGFSMEIFMMLKGKAVVAKYSTPEMFDTMLKRLRQWEAEGKDIKILDVRPSIYDDQRGVKQTVTKEHGIRMTKDEAHKYWGIGEIKIDGVMFDFGRMSYGDYFIEPKSKRPKRETDPFRAGTLWGRVDETNKNYLIFE